MMKVTLMDEETGWKVSLTEEEIIFFVKEHFSRLVGRNVAKKPTEGKWFYVSPRAIDQNVFKDRRPTRAQEAMRQLIVRAFEILNENPDEQGKNFYTMIPETEWLKKSAEDIKVGEANSIELLREAACRLGDGMADWYEQSLEWAQRIMNGENWESLCDEVETEETYARVISVDDKYWLVGGGFDNAEPATVWAKNVGIEDEWIAVPLIVRYED